jgi:hypothetical protein
MDSSAMAVTTLDTHELVKDLKSAGFTEDQAEAVTRAVKQSQQLDFSDLAAKTDVATFRSEFLAKLDNVEAKLTNLIRAELAETRADLLKWGISLALGQGALIIALLELLPGGHS